MLKLSCVKVIRVYNYGIKTKGDKMSIQACRISGIGYELPYNTKIFHNLNEDEEYDLLTDIGLEVGYYQMRDLKSNHKLSPMKIFKDGMSGEYLIAVIVVNASYLENTHGDDKWNNTYRNDDYVFKYARERLERLIGKQDKEPTLINFEHYQ